MMFFANKKDQLCMDMSTVYNGLIQAVKGRRLFAESWEGFADATTKMIETQIPSIAPQFEALEKLIKELADCERQLSNGEERYAEDFRDVIERFAVVYRVNEEFNARKSVFKDCCTFLKTAEERLVAEQAKPTFEKNRSKLEQAVEICKQDKKNALRRYIRKIKQLITVKDSYNKFKIRRFRSGFITYANALKTAAEKEIEIYGRIRDHLAQIKVEDPATGEQLESALNEQMENAPEDAPIDLAEETINNAEEAIDN